MAFNRNIITSRDVERMRAARTADQMPVTLETAPPARRTPVAAGAVAGEQGGESRAPADVAETATADDYLTKLQKYVPPEIVGAYVFVSVIITSNVAPGRAVAWWLGSLLIAMVILTALYCRRVLQIKRVTQILVSCVGLVAYTFALGGWFATTTWYHLWYGSIVLPLFAFAVAILGLKPLPLVGETQS